MRSLLDAEREIAAILKRVELDTGALVESIEVRDTDVTTLLDNGVRIRREVHIALRRNPGAGWDV